MHPPSGSHFQKIQTEWPGHLVGKGRGFIKIGVFM